MPNHVKNRISVIGTEKEVERVFAFIKGERGDIDFNSIIPQPKGIEDTVSGNAPEVKENGWIWELRYGYPSWYEWNCDNWGTKWNAYEIERNDNEIEFETAWSAPHPIVEKLASFFPEVTFEHMWADEDTGYNCGTRQYSDGDVEWANLPESYSDEAYELAFELRPYLRDEMEYVDGKWRWKED